MIVAAVQSASAWAARSTPSTSSMMAAVTVSAPSTSTRRVAGPFLRGGGDQRHGRQAPEHQPEREAARSAYDRQAAEEERRFQTATG